MPEGDAVYLTARRLDRALAGKQLTSTDFRWPSLASVDLAGAKVLGTATHGKHLITRLDHEGRALTLHTHLKMEGSWRVVRVGGARPASDSLVRVVLRTRESEAIGYSLGLVELLRSADAAAVIGRLGPDLLARDWDETTSLERLLADPRRVLGETLLDQTVVAGIGTIYLAEVCFVQGVHPLAAVGSVPDPLRLLRRARQMLQSGVRHGHLISTGDRRQPYWVYRRQQQPCLRCGTLVAAGAVGAPGKERTTYWCPSCQPLADGP